MHLKGASFAEVGSVQFGSTQATSFTVVSGTSITAVVPAGTLGSVDVTVSSPAGSSVVTAATRFTYR